MNRRRLSRRGTHAKSSISAKAQPFMTLQPASPWPLPSLNSAWT